MSQAASHSRLSRFRPAHPLTWGLLLVVVLLHVLVRINSRAEDRLSAYRDFGVLAVQHSAEHPELFGPFDLWSGAWWRIPMCGLHHAGWWHLGIVAVALVYLGRRLEPEIPPLTYFLFLLGALFVTTLPRWQLGPAVPDWFNGKTPLTGLSGVLFAQFGVLLLLRRKDRDLMRNFHEGSILFGIAVGLGCLAFSTIGLVSGLDNLAHIVGFFYGLVWGAVLSFSGWMRRLSVAALVGAHAFLGPVIAGLVHPEENGRYHWWQAETSDDPKFQRQAYRAAVERDPTLRAPWVALAELERQNKQPEKAWDTLVEGLRQNGQLENAQRVGPRIWQELSTKGQRQTAWTAAEHKLRDATFDWSHRLLTPRQSAEFLIEEHQPLRAWAALMRQFRGLLPPAVPDPAPQDGQAEAWNLATAIWGQLSTPSEQRAALEILDEELDRHRRAWHLALIPNRALIPHYQRVGELLWAWEATLRELRENPAFREEGQRIAGEIWRELPTDLRRERARRMVADLFGVEALAWQVELGILSESAQHRYRVDQAIALPMREEDRKAPVPLPPLDPDDPSSAAAGNRL